MSLGHLNAIKVFIILIIVVCIIIFIIYLSPKSFVEFKDLDKEDLGGYMELIFFGLGEADSIFIRYKDKVLLVDSGEVAQGPYIVKSLNNLGVKKIDYLILTHSDKDHIGGAIDIINSMEIGLIIQSPLQKGKSLQEDLNFKIKEKGIKTIVPIKKYDFSLDEITVEVLPPEKSSYKKDNNYSLITLINHNKLSFLLGGDAEKKRLEEVLNYNLPQVTLYKVPHHGRKNSKSIETIKLLSPKISIITNTKADPQILKALEDENSEILYTGSKSIRFFSDGEKLILK